MIKALKKKYALSDQGAKDLLKGIVYSVLANISLMFPVILLAIVLNQLLAPVLGASAPEISAAVYTVIGIVILAVVFIFHYCQYTAAYLGTYDESARRRIGLAEKLRTLPLTEPPQIVQTAQKEPLVQEYSVLAGVAQRERRHSCFALDALVVVKMDVTVNHLIGFREGRRFVAVDTLRFEDRKEISAIALSYGFPRLDIEA